MESVIVPLGDAHLQLTRKAARRLQRDLAEALREEVQKPDGLKPPNVSEDGFMNREDFYEFFGQMYADGPSINSHVGRLFANIVRLSAGTYFGDTIPFVVFCGRCKRTVGMQCADYDKHYYTTEIQYSVSVKSLKEHLNAFVSGDWRNVGRSQKADLQLLVANLP